jgi:hypothetical protein
MRHWAAPVGERGALGLGERLVEVRHAVQVDELDRPLPPTGTR